MCVGSLLGEYVPFLSHFYIAGGFISFKGDCASNSWEIVFIVSHWCPFEAVAHARVTAILCVTHN